MRRPAVCLLLASSLLGGGLASAAAAQDTLMPASEVRRGMKGTCRTVFQGSVVEPFEFEIIDVLHGTLGPKIDLFLARLQGDKALYTGVVAGMSGSPCYLDGKLIGALSYRFGAFTKEPIAGITPIASMLKLFEIPQTPSDPTQKAYQPGSWQQALETRAAAAHISYGSGSMQPISTPLAFSGFDPAVVGKYTDTLNKLGFQPVMSGSGGSSGNPAAPKQLEMGGAIAGQLVRGDISVSGTGTVSYINGKQVLAFGHPFFNSGNVKIPMATSYVQHILVSETGSYKMAEDGPEVGTITHDRLTAIAGYLGEHTRMLPVQFNLADQANVDANTLNFEVIQDPGYTPMMMAMAVQNSLQSRLQYNLGGNLSLDGQIRVDGQDLRIQRFFSATPQADTPSQAVEEVAKLFFTLWNNPFQQPRIDKVQMNFKFQPQTRVASIDEVWATRDEVRPGESVDVNVRLRTWRNETMLRQIKMQVPSDTPYGPLMVLASSGPLLDQLEGELQTGYRSYADLLADLATSRSNDRLYLKLVTEEPGLTLYSDLYSKLPPSILEHLSGEANGSYAVPLMRSPGAEYSLPTGYDLQGQRVLRLTVTPRGRVIN
ncbi:MAG: hypothetical protein ACO1RX_00895 [Candidatus Sericytochromatia bacterium]